MVLAACAPTPSSTGGPQTTGTAPLPIPVEQVSPSATKPSTTLDGLGASTFTCVDKDGDGYGVGPGCIAPDADDRGADVHDAAAAIDKYGSLRAFLSHLGYAPGHVFYLATDGDDDTGLPDDPAHPYRTWDKLNVLMANGTFQAGDAVIFRAGTF